MITANNVSVTAPPHEISIGITGEHGFRPVVIDWSEWLKDYPGAKLTAVYQPPGTTGAYPVILNASESPAICPA